MFKNNINEFAKLVALKRETLEHALEEFHHWTLTVKRIEYEMLDRFWQSTSPEDRIGDAMAEMKIAKTQYERAKADYDIIYAEYMTVVMEPEF